ncbi:MAG TPA: STAS domain-containing protein [Solirubrobacteraceae bacterium]|nr:STAS domain-containing protein [Solirubrobacteraceae bacterium]
MQSNFRVEVRREGDVPVVSLYGELDLASSPALEDELERLLATAPSVVVIDLRELDFMDSTGLSVLIRAHHRAHEAGHRLAVVNGTRQVRRLLSLTGLAERLTVVDDPRELIGEG